MKNTACCFFFLLFLLSSGQAFAVCDPEFVNPIDDVAWDCVRPITFSGAVMTGSGPDPGTIIRDPVCVCKDGAISTVGLTVGFWEPGLMFDVVKDGWCFNGLGFNMSSGSPEFGGGQSGSWTDGSALGDGTSGGQTGEAGFSDYYFGQAHMYWYPVWAVLDLFLDWQCTDNGKLDIGTITEVDVTWNDDFMAIYLQPEQLLFANPMAAMACSVDSVASTAGFSLDSLYWCEGTWGGPVGMVTGFSRASDPTMVMPSAALVGKLIYKLHREFVLWGQSGVEGLCGAYPMPVWKKSQYKIQPVLPVSTTSCVPVGRSGLTWAHGTNPPSPGKADNFTYLGWRKRDCCTRGYLSY